MHLRKCQHPAIRSSPQRLHLLVSVLQRFYHCPWMHQLIVFTCKWVPAASPSNDDSDKNHAPWGATYDGRLFFPSFYVCVFWSSGRWYTQCPHSCQLPTSLVWYSHWRHTPTFTTSMLEKDRVRTIVTTNIKLHLAWLHTDTVTYHTIMSLCVSTQWLATMVQWSTGHDGGL